MWIPCLIKSKSKMLQEKAGNDAGLIWNALNGTDGLSVKDLKKATKIKTDKDLFLGLGWLLRENKITTSETEEGELLLILNE